MMTQMRHAQARESRGVDPKHLSKIRRISHEDAQSTIDVTTQTSIRTDDPLLSRITLQMIGC